jgi:hypothetical protein
MIKSFKCFINEITLLGKTEKKANGLTASDAHITNNAKKVSSLVNHKGEPHHVFLHGTDHTHTYYVTDHQGQNQLAVNGTKIYHDGKMVGLQINMTQAKPNNSIRASDVYKHLIMHHGLNLVSDVNQTESGNAIWNRLAEDKDLKSHIMIPKSRTMGDYEHFDVPATKDNRKFYSHDVLDYDHPSYNRDKANARIALYKNPNIQ